MGVAWGRSMAQLAPGMIATDQCQHILDLGSMIQVAGVYDRRIHDPGSIIERE